jgi:hypothetical protein
MDIQAHQASPSGATRVAMPDGIKLQSISARREAATLMRILAEHSVIQSVKLGIIQTELLFAIKTAKVDLILHLVSAIP